MPIHRKWFAVAAASVLAGQSGQAEAQAEPVQSNVSPPPDVGNGVAAAPPPTPLPVLTLATIERDALAQQPQVLVAKAQTRAAEAGVEQTFSPFLPQLSGVGQYSYGTSVRTSTAGNTGTTTSNAVVSSSPLGFWTFSVSGTQLIYDFGQTYGRYRAAKDTVDADRASEAATRFQVTSAVRVAYFTARADKELVGVARETALDQERHLAQVQGFVAVGTQPAIALAQQKAAVANALVQLITAQNNYETAKAQLNQAAGIRRGTEYDVGDEALVPVPDEDEPLDGLLRKALSDRPEIASFIKQRVAQESTVRAIKGAYGPTLSATGSIGEVGVNLADLQSVWTVGALLSWPFFQGGLTTGQVHQAEATLAGLDAQEEQEVLEVQFQVDSARLAVRAAKATIGAADDAFESAHEQLRLAEQRYATGVGSIIELNDAQVTYTTAAAQRVQARYGLASARAQLLAALGRT